MKKIYTIPQIQVYNVKTQNMLAASTLSITDDVDNPIITDIQSSIKDGILNDGNLFD